MKNSPYEQPQHSCGRLIVRASPEAIPLKNKACFLGMGFGTRAPIDILTIFLAGLEVGQYTLLVTDEFQRLNGTTEETIALGLRRTQKALAVFTRLYQFDPEILLASELMQTSEYHSIQGEIEGLVTTHGLFSRLLDVVPERYRTMETTVSYPLHEIACTEFLRRTRGIEVKIGPSSETAYDRIMQDLELPLSFAYLQDSYALGSRGLESVVPYIPGHRGSTNGQRLYLDEPLRTAKAKLLLGPDEALHALLRLASIAGRRLGKHCFTEEQMTRLHGKKLKKATKKLVLENILKPYREVMAYGI